MNDDQPSGASVAAVLSVEFSVSTMIARMLETIAAASAARAARLAALERQRTYRSREREVPTLAAAREKQFAAVVRLVARVFNREPEDDARRFLRLIAAELRRHEVAKFVAPRARKGSHPPSRRGHIVAVSAPNAPNVPSALCLRTGSVFA